MSPAGGQAAWRWEPRSPASTRGPPSPAGVRPRPGPPSIYLETSPSLLCQASAPAPGEALSPELLSEPQQGRCGSHSEGGPPGEAKCVQPPDGAIRLHVWLVSHCLGRERPLGRMFHPLWEDSVNIKQPLASQTRFQAGTCNPLAQPSREATGQSCRMSWGNTMCMVAAEEGRARAHSSG